jgi:hypothetical protein
MSSDAPGKHTLTLLSDPAVLTLLKNACAAVGYALV